MKKEFIGKNTVKAKDIETPHIAQKSDLPKQVIINTIQSAKETVDESYKIDKKNIPISHSKSIVSDKSDDEWESF